MDVKEKEYEEFKKFHKKTNKFIGSFCIIISTILLIVSISTFMDCKKFKNTSKETTATVTKINSSTKSKTYRQNGRTKHKNITVYNTYFEYDVNGKTLDSVIELSYSKQIGDTFTIWYDKNNPSDVRNNNGSYASAGFAAFMSLIFAGVGITMFIGYTKTNLEKKKK